MNRKPPTNVRRALRREVGFGCPVPNCGSPYLEWHHFDPPWRVRHHHNPKGMIALCTEHHPMADAGAYTVDQLHGFKVNGKKNCELIKGKFEWLRNKLLVVLGGCFYYETLTILEIRKLPVIWLRRDENGYLLLNLKMLTTTREERLWLQDNFWMAKGNPIDFECPPSGKLIHAKYRNDDEIRVEFFELSSVEDIQKRYVYARPADWGINLPVTAVEIQTRVGGTDLSFGPNWSMLPGKNVFVGGFFSHLKCGISIS